jgi:hypothetical protein
VLDLLVSWRHWRQSRVAGVGPVFRASPLVLTDKDSWLYSCALVAGALNVTPMVLLWEQVLLGASLSGACCSVQVDRHPEALTARTPTPNGHTQGRRHSCQRVRTIADGGEAAARVTLDFGHQPSL